MLVTPAATSLQRAAAGIGCGFSKWGADARSCESRCVRDRSFVGFVGYPEHYPGKGLGTEREYTL